jgi:hypothetical protein
MQGAPKLPFLSLEDALDWKRRAKDDYVPGKELNDGQYLDRLKNRHHVSVPWPVMIFLSRLANLSGQIFLIDDSASMKSHWKHVVLLFEALSYMVKDVGPDGFDLWFTGPGKPLRNCRTTTAPLHAVQYRKQQGTTDIVTKLDPIFQDYLDVLKKPRSGVLARLSKPIMPLSLYILTDGLWEKNCNPVPLVEGFARKLENLGEVKSKVGIQFISFGEDPVGLDRMELLDSGLIVHL